jgi:hypothetical protein
MNSIKELTKQLNTLHSEFPELLQEGPIGQAIGGVARNLPVVGKAIVAGMDAYNKTKQPAQTAASTAAPAQPGAPQKPGFFNSVANLAGTVVGNIANNKAQKTSALSALSTAGQSGIEILNKAAQAITAYAGSAPQAAAAPETPVAPTTESAIRDYVRLMQEFAQTPLIEAGFGIAPGQATQNPTAAPKPQDAKPASKQKPQDAVMNAAKNFASKIQGKDAAEWATDQSLIKGLKTIIQGATQFKVSIPGLEGITPESIDQAVQETQQAAQPEQAAPDEKAAEQQVAQMPPDQLLQTIGMMDRRKLLALAQDPEVQKAIAQVLMAKGVQQNTGQPATSTPVAQS